MKKNILTIIMKLLDLFSGAGGFSLAFKRVFPCEEIIGFSEIDKYASQVYKHHFEGVKEYGAVESIQPELPDFDILSGGFPCQSFSIAGKRGGFEDVRGTLFFEIARIAFEKQPSYLILENVKGLLSHEQGRTFGTILSTLDEVGYDVQWEVLNSKNFGVPQNRERVFIIGHLRREPRPEIFPIGESDGIGTESEVWGSENIAGTVGTKNNSPQWRFDASTTLISNSKQGRGWVERGNGVVPPLRSHNNAGSDNLVQIGSLKDLDRQQNRIYSTEGIAKTISDGGGLGAKTGLYAVKGDLFSRNEPKGQYGFDEKNMFCLRRAVTHAIQITHHQPRCGDPGKGGIGKLSNSEYCYTVDSQPHLVNKIRRLTPKECERLQGFPNGWTEYGINKNGETVKISDTQRYKLMGNAITVNVAEEIFKRLARERVIC